MKTKIINLLLGAIIIVGLNNIEPTESDPFGDGITAERTLDLPLETPSCILIQTSEVNTELVCKFVD